MARTGCGAGRQRVYHSAVLTKPFKEIVFPYPLRAIVMRSETLCVRECCGQKAFGFDPFNIAGALLIFPDDIKRPEKNWKSEVSLIRTQLDECRQEIATYTKDGIDIVIPSMHAQLPAREALGVCDKISVGLERAAQLLEQEYSSPSSARAVRRSPLPSKGEEV